MAKHLPIGSLKTALGWSWYGDANPVHTSPLANDSDSTYEGLCYTSCRVLAGTRDCTMGPTGEIDPTTYRTMNGRCTTVASEMVQFYFTKKLKIQKTKKTTPTKNKHKSNTNNNNHNHKQTNKQTNKIIINKKEEKTRLWSVKRKWVVLRYRSRSL